MKNIVIGNYVIARQITIDSHVEVYLLNIDENINYVNTSIIPNIQIAEINRYRIKHDSQKRLLARSFLYELLAKKYSLDDFTLFFTKYKKPYLKGGNNIHFSFSYARNYLLVGISIDKMVGVDIEYINPAINIHELASLIMCPAELHQLNLYNDNASIQHTYFLKLFSGKESIIKAFGTGLAYDVKTLHILNNTIYTHNNVEYIYRDLELWQNQYTLAACYEQ
jgi:4'-phosphopantetheinyl transferase